MAATPASSNSSPRHYTPIPPPRQASPKAESSYGKTETTTTTSGSRSSDNANRYLGSFLILLAEFFACAMHVIIRYLQISLPAERRLHAMHLTFIRSFPTVVFCLGYGWGWRRIESMPLGRRDVRGRLRARALGGCVAIMCSFSKPSSPPPPPHDRNERYQQGALSVQPLLRHFRSPMPPSSRPSRPLLSPSRARAYPRLESRFPPSRSCRRCCRWLAWS